MSAKPKRALIALEVSPFGVENLRWMKHRPTARPKTRWIIRLYLGTAGYASVPGWEHVLFSSYTKAMEAIIFIEEKKGGYEEFKKRGTT